MADEKLEEIFVANPITVGPGTLAYGVTDRDTTTEDAAFDYAQLMTNRYRIVVTVSADDLIVSLKHEDGTTDPSADYPLYFKIGNVLRAVTAATSITIVDGTNWFDSGAPRFGGVVRPYFVYLVWDSNSSIVALSISPIPYGALVSDFSATTTNEKHLYNYANFTSTDDVINIGYFEATLSLVATSYLWTVPTFTSYNLKHQRTERSNIVTWTPIWTNLTITSATVTARYQIDGRRIWREVDVVFGASTAISGGVQYSLPFSPNGYGTTSANGVVRLYDQSTGVSNAGLSYILTSTVILVAQNAAGTYVVTAGLSSTAPMTWTTLDELGDAGWYFI